MTEKISTFSDLRAYRQARNLAHQLYEKSRQWPKDEIYSLTSQVRRSSRAVGASLAEAWAKRRYPAHFLSKLTDADAELQETCHWIETASECGYLSAEEASQLLKSAKEIGKMIGTMMLKHESFCRVLEKEPSSAIRHPAPGKP
jgi:four helix bundle protein